MSSNCVNMFDFVKKRRFVYNPNLTDKEIEILMSLPNEYHGFYKEFRDGSLVEYVKGRLSFLILNAKGTNRFSIYKFTQTDTNNSSNFKLDPISMNVELDVAVSRILQAIEGEGTFA